MDICIKCNKLFERSEAQKIKGHRECKECISKVNRNQYKRRKELGLLPSYDERKRRRGSDALASDRERLKKYRKRPDVKLRACARAATAHAVKVGRLIKEPCNICGVEKVEAHHLDYLKPLEVEWYCLKHHRELHWLT